MAATSTALQNQALEDQSLPIVSVLDRSQEYKVKMSSAPRAYVNEAIGKLLSGKFLAGLASLIQVALDQFLGNAAAQESEKIYFHIMCASASSESTRCYTSRSLRLLGSKVTSRTPSLTTCKLVS